MLFQLEKVLQQGDISEIADPYMKESKDDKVRNDCTSVLLCLCLV